MFFNSKRKVAKIKKKYLNAVYAIKGYANEINSNTNQITYLKLIRAAIIDDLASDFNNKILYDGNFKNDEHRFNNPYACSDEKHVSYLKKIEAYYECDLSRDRIISFPWDSERFVSAFNSVASQGFIYIPTNHKIKYFPQLNLYIAFNGLHSLSAGVATKKGLVPCCEVYDVTRMFEAIYSEDGIHWKSESENIFADNIPDFRFALIYEVSKMMWKLENSGKVEGAKL